MSSSIVKTIAAALDVSFFRDARLSTPVRNAQDALTGITHYCDADTLRYHHSRIVGAVAVSGGAFFKIIETCSQDYDNTRRGYRVVLFDLTGTAVYRPDLEELTRTKEQADKAFWEWFNQFDELAHYRNKLNRKADKLARQITELNDAELIIAAEQEGRVSP
ncbi:MAG: hypothetical protein AN484_11890 [Aphanizomenon flos-aquae WA102]|uniref:Uncharacterized protein n=1 Tax=Aphanizomenon flos-aquae WA102 TaxID=1710896 RepID=A0A1B7X2A6_APHFL|nr:MAG: hypothetical protein AN484_11890 [Aphanizomenon flos-aquae WA102]